MSFHHSQLPEAHSSHSTTDTQSTQQSPFLSATTFVASPSNSYAFPPSHMEHRSTSSPVPTSPVAVQTIQSIPLPPKKKQGRGPGKKDAKDKPPVSVRWEDGDLSDRLISALESNDRWAGVLAQAPSDPSQPRVLGVPKRDLQRELARHLFRDDKWNLEDKTILEALAVSIKNKVFKITTLYSECKTELGYASTFKDERDVPPGSEYAVTWARVKEKFPQFYRIRDMMNRLPPPGTPRNVEEGAPVSQPDPSSTSVAAPPTISRSRQTSSASAIINMSGHPQHPPMHSASSSLRGAVELPKEASSNPTAAFGLDPSSLAGSAYMQAAASSNPGLSSATGPSGYPIHHTSPPLQSANVSSYRGTLPSRRNTHSSQLNVNVGVQQPHQGAGLLGLPHSAPIVHHQPATIYAPAPMTASPQRGSPYQRPAISIAQPSAMLPPDSSASLSSLLAPHQPLASSSRSHDYPPEPMSPPPTGSSGGNPSPPLSTTAEKMLAVLTERRDREQQRAHELEMARMKREEAERIRWHQREMMRLRIQLIRAERNNLSGGAPGSAGGRSQFGVTDEELAMVAGIGDDMHMEGDGEGEPDDDMHDPMPDSGRMQGPSGTSSSSSRGLQHPSSNTGMR